MGLASWDECTGELWYPQLIVDATTLRALVLQHLQEAAVHSLIICCSSVSLVFLWFLNVFLVFPYSLIGFT